MEAVWTRPATLNLVSTPSEGSSPCFWNHGDCWCLTDHSVPELFNLPKVWPWWAVSWSVWKSRWKLMFPAPPQNNPAISNGSNDVAPVSTQRCCPLRRLISSQRSSIHEPMRSDDAPARVGKTLGIGFEMRLWMTPVLSHKEELKIQLCSRRV